MTWSNWVDLVYLIIGSILIVLDVVTHFGKMYGDWDLEYVKNIRFYAGFCVIAMWIKMLDWLRLFKPTAFFISLT